MLPISFRVAIIAIFCLCLSSVLRAQTPAADPDAITLQMMDGSQLAGKLSVAELAVDTPFGSLRVPISAIKSLTPGLDSHPELAKQISDLITKLASDVYADREAAQTALLKLGPAVRGPLVKARAAADTEQRTRLDAVLAEFDQMADPDDDSAAPTPQYINEDAIETTTFTIVGKITTPSFQITSLYGPLTIKLSDIKHGFRPTAAPDEIRKTFSVSGNENTSRTWASPNITINKGDKITVSADGQITMSPWGMQARTGPDGMQNYGNYPGGDGSIFGGTLVARIGKGGPVIKIGSKASFTADRTGKIEFAMALQADYGNQQFPGEYSVKMKVQKKQ